MGLNARGVIFKKLVAGTLDVAQALASWIHVSITQEVELGTLLAYPLEYAPT